MTRADLKTMPAEQVERLMIVHEAWEERTSEK